MKLLVLLPSWAIGGAERAALHLGQALQRLGVAVTVVTWARNGPLREEFEGAGLETICLQCSKRFDPFGLVKLRKVIKTLQPDVVHAHLFPLNWMLALFATKESPAMVYTEHSTYNRRRSIRAFRPIEKKIYSRLKRVITVSKEVQDTLLDWIPSLDNVVCIPNGVPALDIVKGQVANSKGPIQLLFVGRLAPPKGVDTLLDACSLLKRLGENFHLDIVGDGPLRKTLEDKTHRMALNNSVCFHGFVSDTTRFYLNDPIVVIPSFWEGLPLTLLESMRAECAIVASDVGGISEALIDQRSGILVPPGDAQALRDSILALASNTKLRRSISVRAKQVFLETYTVSEAARSHLKLYESLII